MTRKEIIERETALRDLSNMLKTPATQAERSKIRKMQEEICVSLVSQGHRQDEQGHWR